MVPCTKTMHISRLFKIILIKVLAYPSYNIVQKGSPPLSFPEYGKFPYDQSADTNAKAVAKKKREKLSLLIF